MLIREYLGGKVEVVEDPHSSENEAFEVIYQQCIHFSRNFLKAIFLDMEA
jgi:hypothetical protein